MGAAGALDALLARQAQLGWCLWPLQPSSRRGSRLRWRVAARLLSQEARSQAKEADERPAQHHRRPAVSRLLRGGEEAQQLADLCQALNVADEQELRDLMNCLVVAEGAYKVVDLGRARASKMVARIKACFPPGLVTLRRVQWSLPSVYHRYMLAEDEATLYVAFMGTKQRRDLVTNAAVLQAAVWPDAPASEADAKAGAVPAAHRGFLARARAIPIEGLYAHACQRGKRLVLTGHSLGGAVAALSTLRLLQQLPPDASPAVRCVTFACPAVGNPALAEYARARGWERFFQNLLVPEDVVPRLLASPAQSPQQVADATIAALQPAEAAALGAWLVEDTLALFEDVFDAIAPRWHAAERTGGGHAQLAGSVSGQLPAKRAGHERLGLLPVSLGEEEDEEREEALRSLQAEAAAMAPESGAEASEEDQAELAELRGELTARALTAQAGSARTGSSRRRVGRERLGPSQDVFFPWSASPLPPFARELAGAALRRAGGLGRLRPRRLPPARPRGSEVAPAAALAVGGRVRHEDARASAQPAEVEERAPPPAGRQLASGQGISSRLGANVGKAARGAARIVAAPLRVAQRSYAAVGRQAFLGTAAVLPLTEGDAELSFQQRLEGERRSSGSTALSLPPGASASTIVSLQLPLAAAARRQPFLMHKMAFHRARVLGIVERRLGAGRGLGAAAAAEEGGQALLSGEVAPPMQPTRAEVFLPYTLPDGQDVRAMLEDLGTLSALPPLTAVVARGGEGGRFRWLRPWRWISGLGWGRASTAGSVELTAQVQGRGLQHCTSVQVQAASGVWCRTEVVRRPQQAPAAEVHARLGLHRRGLARALAAAALWLREAAAGLNGVLDRTNAMGAADCLVVKVALPLEVVRAMEEQLLAAAGDDSGLTVHLTSDFRTARLPLAVHGGGSWLLSDLRRGSRSLSRWVDRLGRGQL